MNQLILLAAIVSVVGPIWGHVEWVFISRAERQRREMRRPISIFRDSTPAEALNRACIVDLPDWFWLSDGRGQSTATYCPLPDESLPQHIRNN